ncbi:hypothetical protein [Scytonema sp. PCC 10023]|uniref:hypothetical protein n=1 Tax=Scytonema sp. PCC 10023 TaxID=1680591 RepID=UPI0039C751DF
MEEKPYFAPQTSGEQDTSNKFSRDNEHLLVHFHESKALIDAIDKYEQAVKRYIDPEINREETILIVSALIEKLASSLPRYLQEEPGMKQGLMDVIKEMREKGFPINQSLKEQFIKFVVGMKSMIQQTLAKTFSFIRSTKT